ncbi:MAG: nucleotidyltransferase domain-containing protein [Armatimonadota bacterium]
MDQQERQNLLSRIKAAVLSVVPDAEVSLYGSRARGDERDDSDWDILILLPEKPTEEVKDSIHHRIYDIELETGQLITSVYYSKHEWEREDRRQFPFRRNVRAEAKRL